MALNLEQKKAIVAEVTAVAQASVSAVAAEYHGLTSNDMNSLRKQARDAGVNLRIVRNTLARRAVEGTSFECMKEKFTGPLILAFAPEENPSAAARLVRDFAKTNKALDTKSLAFNGDLMEASELDKLAKMPTRDEGIAMLMGLMKEPVAKLARTLAAVRDQKEAEAAA
ncbi:50S ribosomal protein L10 [Piscirickettsia litoralis]|uniref:Large ribosomal subunit protein uL10 n=1 Tax=Piscirickettsia litoralis TaxID=1891921 RepID=A0ABX3A1U4_9GAMM|nr:50S ribosomal protein L10 [Piscirickettsia litoralis]ODN42826.1 50S ribosomal protein L10 [Piscirickettsia litoralis]